MGVQYVDIDVPHGVAEAVVKVDGVALASLIDEGRFVDRGQAVLCAQDETVDGGYMMRFGRTYARPQEDVWRALTRPRSAIEELRRTDEVFDADAALAAFAAWDEALAAPPWAGPPRRVHADLMPSNLLVTAGRLTAVLDFATIGIGDPACDLIPAWNLHSSSSARTLFWNAVDVDDATWTRGRGWALSMAAIQLPYYRNTNPTISANARHVIRETAANS